MQGSPRRCEALRDLSRLPAGEVIFEGRKLNGMPTHQITALGISMVPEGRAIFANLTVLENLEMGAYLQKDRAQNAASLERVFTLFPRLKERRKQAGGTLSGGEQQMLAIGRALMARPRLLLLDEPSLGLAPLLVHTIFGAIDAINKEGTTILLVEQNANAALRHSHRAYVLETGTIVMEGPSAATCRRSPREGSLPRREVSQRFRAFFSAFSATFYQSGKLDSIVSVASGLL